MVLMSAQEIEGNRLRGELRIVCGHLNVLHAELVSITHQALTTNAWHGDGVRSIEHWLAWQAGLSTATATKIAAIARRTNELPETTQLFTNGLLSLDQTAAVARHTPTHHDHTAAVMAHRSDRSRDFGTTQIEDGRWQTSLPTGSATSDCRCSAASSPVTISTDPTEPLIRRRCLSARLRRSTRGRAR
ncbi:MAG: DUF222 domain-containing protein [Ilumatobacteraceae bacterium]